MATQHNSLSYFNKEEIPNCKNLKIAIVVSQWNQLITDKLKEGAEKTLIECGLQKKNILVYHVPGSYELIFGARIAAKKSPNAIICLGSVIQGETKHFDFVCNAVSNGIKDLNIKLDTPVIFGVLTDNNIEQAKNRSGGKYGNKGVESAITAIKMAILNK